MKTVVIFGANSMGMVVAGMLSPCEMRLTGLGDTRAETWNVLSNLEEGELKEEIQGMPVMPIDLAVALQPGIIVIVTTDPEKGHALQYMAIRTGFLNSIIFIRDLYQRFSTAYNILRRICHRLTGPCIEGSVAEPGYYRGDTSWQLSALMPDRRLYLFDAFEGFNPRDTVREQELAYSNAEAGQFSDADEGRLMECIPVEEQVIVKKGWFPETALDMEDETFALVYMDACLYSPTFSGLEFFFPRMVRGGVILLKGSRRMGCGDVAKAVEDLEAKYGALLMLPASGLSDTLMITHPQLGPVYP